MPARAAGGAQAMPVPHDFTDDALAGHFRVLQRRKGHRYSLDDTLTAAVAARQYRGARGAARVLDMGCGLGSVLLMLAYKLPTARLWAIEAQAESHALCQQNIARNGVAGRVTLVHGDLRDAAVLDAVCAGGRFDLVSGTPPYQPPGRGTVSPDPQRAHARVELRGGVEDYLASAARAVSESGRVVVCADARTPERVEAGARAAGLWPLTRLDAVPIEGHKAPLFSVFTLCHPSDPAYAGVRPELQVEPAFVARTAEGGRSAAALELRRFFDLPVDADEPASPRQRARSQQQPQGKQA